MTTAQTLSILTMICALNIRRVVLASVSPARQPAQILEEPVRRGSHGAQQGSSAPYAVVLGLSVGLLSKSLSSGVCIGVALVVLLPMLKRWAAIRIEAQRFRSALPQFIEEFARGLRGGLSPAQALLNGADSTAPPFPNAFATAATMLAAGASASEAIDAWADKRNDSSLRFLATAMAVGDAVGGIDGRSADAVAVALRERNSTEAIVRVQATQALYSAGVLCGAPVVFCSLVVMTDQRSSAFLLDSPVGRIIGVAGVSLDVIGALWMRRLVRQVVQ
jgi:tight adherence protein B